MNAEPRRRFSEKFKSLFKDDGNNPLVALGIVFAMGVVPLAIAAGAIGCIGWLGFLGVKAAVALATTGSLAGVLSPTAALGTIVGGGALLAAGAYTGVNQALWRNFSMKFLGKDPERQEYAPQEPTSTAWQEMIREKNARRDFGNAAKPDATPETALLRPAPGSPKPPVSGSP